MFLQGLSTAGAITEIDYNKIDKLRGLEVAIITTARNDDEARHLLEQMGMPFSKNEE